MLKTLFIASIMIFSTVGSIKDAKIDTTASTVQWTGKKVTGSHSGSIKLKNGTLKIENGELVGGNFTIDMTSITNSDLSGDQKANLEGHLKSGDFFGVDKYPTATFEITQAVPQGPGKYKVVGDITIKGTTEEVQFSATLEETKEQYIAKAEFAIDRSKFNVRYGSGSFFDNLGDKTIYDEFDLKVEIVSTKE